MAQAEEDGGEERDGPVDAVFDRPGEPEERNGDEDGTDVGEGEAVFGFWFGVVPAREGVVDGVDFRDDEPDCDEEAQAGTEVHEADLGGVEGVRRGAVDGLEVGVEAVGGAEEDGLVDCHC